MSKAALLAAVALALAGPDALAQQSAEDALKRPIAESDLLKTLEPAEPAAAALKVPEPPVQRAIPVHPRDYVPAPPPDPAPAPAEPEKKRAGQTVITSERAVFNNRQHLAVFSIKVTVNDPEFDLTCDELTAHLKHDDLKTGEPAAAAKVAPATGAEARPSGKGRLERAEARGHVVIIQVKENADGGTEQSIAWAERADYNARTGDIVLSGMPIVQQGINRCTATSPTTTITLNRDRNMQVDGQHRTTITDKAELETKKTETPRKRTP